VYVKTKPPPPKCLSEEAFSLI
ncbi:hypothetical protein CCACVL1_25025, partial [Corchorus capsularis]